MCFRQAEYTSCRKDGHSGFQLRASTPGIAEHDIDDIIRFGLHRQPHPATPPEEALHHCPVAYRWLRTSANAHVLQRSQYLGYDDTGRAGNFFTHSLICDEPPPKLAHWIMDYYEWAGWRKPCEPCNETDTLPSVSLSDVTPAESFSWTELSLFLHESPQRPAWLTSMLATLFTALTLNQRIVIIDEKENNPYWIACLTKLLPRDIANALSFSTYQKDALPGVDITASTPEASLPNLANEHRFAPALHAAPLPAQELVHSHAGIAYARDVVQLLLHTPERIADLMGYLALFEWKALTGNLYCALQLYMHMHIPEDLHTQPVSEREALAVIRFVTDKTKMYAASPKNILRQTWPFFQSLSPENRFRCAPALINYLLSDGDFSHIEERETLCLFWCDACNVTLRYAIHSPVTAAKHLTHLLDHMHTLLARLPEHTQKLLCGIQKHLDMPMIIAALPHLPCKYARDMFRFARTAILQTSSSANATVFTLQQLAQAYGNTDDTRLIFRLALLTPRERCVVLRSKASQFPKRTGFLLHRLHKETPPHEAALLRALLASTGAMACLVVELRNALTNAPDPQPATLYTAPPRLGQTPVHKTLCKQGVFLTYMAEILGEHPTWPRTAWLHVFLRSLEHTPTVRNEALLWILPGLTAHDCSRYAKQWFAWANAACIPHCASMPDKEKNAGAWLNAPYAAARLRSMQSLATLAKLLEYKLTPHRPSLWTLLHTFSLAQLPPEATFATAMAALHLMSIDERRVWVDLLQHAWPSTVPATWNNAWQRVLV